jgi:hypothetical protein
MTLNSVFYNKEENSSFQSLLNSKWFDIKDFTTFRNDIDKTKTENYVKKLETYKPDDPESQFFGCDLTDPTSIHFGALKDSDYRNRFINDLFVDTKSDIYFDNADFPLPYKVKPNDHSYDTAMELDFMAVW